MINVSQAIESIDAIVAQSQDEIMQAPSLEAVEDLRARLLGLGGVIQMKHAAAFGEMTIADRPAWGETISDAKEEIHGWIADRRRQLNR